MLCFLNLPCTIRTHFNYADPESQKEERRKTRLNTAVCISTYKRIKVSQEHQHLQGPGVLPNLIDVQFQHLQITEATCNFQDKSVGHLPQFLLKDGLWQLRGMRPLERACFSGTTAAGHVPPGLPHTHSCGLHPRTPERLSQVSLPTFPVCLLNKRVRAP